VRLATRVWNRGNGGKKDEPSRKVKKGMSDIEPDTSPTVTSRRSPLLFIKREWPYFLMLALAVGGVAYTAVARRYMKEYWILLAPVFGLICVYTGWRKIATREERIELLWIQAFHWSAVLLAMYLMFIASLRQIMSSVASALMLLVVLALGTFAAGLQARSWRICLVGILLALGVPAVAWLTLSTLLVVLLAAFLIVFVMMPFMRS
jgi:hypothetical protein